MAKTDQETLEKLKKMLADQTDIESRWYGIKHLVSETDLKDPKADALSKCRDRLTALVRDLLE